MKTVRRENLERQGYQCYRSILPSEKLRQGLLKVSDEPLFRITYPLGADSLNLVDWLALRGEMVMTA